MFKISANNKLYEFVYDISSKKKIHLINYYNFNLYSNNPLFDMLNTVLYKDVNFNNNKKISLFANSIIDSIKNKYLL